jgi:GTP-binding protein
MPTFLKSAAAAAHFPPDSGREVAVVGRSNSGKSSAINAILDTKLARVSKTPGRTQLINFFSLGVGRRLVDLPGYGYARVGPDVRRRWQRLLADYFETRQSLAGLMLTVDVRRGLVDLDRTMLTWLAELGVPAVLLVTKADKLSRGASQAALSKIARTAPPHVSTQLFSAVDRRGVEAARAQLDAWLGADERSPGREYQGTRPGPKSSRLG